MYSCCTTREFARTSDRPYCIPHPRCRCEVEETAPFPIRALKGEKIVFIGDSNARRLMYAVCSSFRNSLALDVNDTSTYHQDSSCSIPGDESTELHFMWSPVSADVLRSHAGMSPRFRTAIVLYGWHEGLNLTSYTSVYTHIRSRRSNATTYFVSPNAMGGSDGDHISKNTRLLLLLRSLSNEPFFVDASGWSLSQSMRRLPCLDSPFYRPTRIGFASHIHSGFAAKIQMNIVLWRIAPRGPERILVTGDVAHSHASMMHESMQGLLGDADVSIANLEGVVRSAPSPSLREGKPVLTHSRLVGMWLRGAGVGVVNVANNHMWDLGGEGLKRTADSLLDSGLSVVGARPRCRVRIETRSRSCTVVTSCSMFYNQRVDPARVCPCYEVPLLLSTARCDMSLVIIHAGSEYGHAVPNRTSELVRSLRRGARTGKSYILIQHGHDTTAHGDDAFTFHSLGSTTYRFSMSASSLSSVLSLSPSLPPRRICANKRLLSSRVYEAFLCAEALQNSHSNFTSLI